MIARGVISSTGNRGLTRRMVIMLATAAVVLGGIFGYQAFKAHMLANYMRSMGQPVQTVASAVAHYDMWQPHLEAVGSARAVNGADLSPQVSGIVSAIHFESGADVNEGTVLVELMNADDQAKLQALKAQAALARITFERDQRQLKVQGVSQQTVDADEQTLKSDEAEVAQQQAILDYKIIKAPFAGRLGIRMVDLGQYVGAGTPIVTLQSLDPIYVDFNLPQQSIDDVKVGQPVSASFDTYPGQRFQGEVSAINSKVDPATRNIQVRATLKNPDHKILPGMFATVQIDSGRSQRYITLPQTAVTYNPYGDSVFIIDNQGKDEEGHPKLVVRQTLVKTGQTRGDLVAILSGVKDGDTVVTAGQIKLRNGTPVIVDNSTKPAVEANPTPVDQ
ncbi:MAG TPA: efflux RND transporter periplasmic adaptor subunit [Alphaproteobacteria bacterium]|nr:efflux RND transporter periplasmic adaptor subunit [Alphaproteobacteria bacterium]